MITQIAFLQEAAATAAKGENPYGLKAALEQGGLIAWATFLRPRARRWPRCWSACGAGRRPRSW